jgi:RNA polymerase primary sigma factor
MTMKAMNQEMETLAPYLEAARGRRPLSRESERELVVRAQRGDARAKNELVRHNVALVVMLARKQSRGTIRLEELVQEGNLGLLRAIEKFDPSAGTRFSTYAVWWIRAFVWKYLKQARSAVRPRSGTVAASDLSLDASVGEDGDVSYLDRLEDEGPGPHEAYATAEDAARVRGALDKVRKRLGELGWDIVHTRLRQDPPDTLEQIGNRWGVSRERVRQVELQTKRFLQGYLGPMREADAERDAA